MPDIAELVLTSSEPSIRYQALIGLGLAEPDSPEAARAREEVRTSERVRTLLSGRDASGRIPGNEYAKWYGAHWVFAQLADLGCPPGDASLHPLRDQVYDFLIPKGPDDGRIRIEGRVRHCGAWQGNGLLATLALGVADERSDQLAEMLLRWRWPDGGWNCDKRPEAVNSSFHETLIPMRALHLYGRMRGSAEALAAAYRASELFLRRRLFRRERDGAVMDPRFMLLRYPAYWHYGILQGLQVMDEMGLLGDERCAEALDLLESKRLPDGGFPAEDRMYKVTTRKTATGCHASLVDWGGVSSRRMNPWVTVEALTVLRAAGR